MDQEDELADEIASLKIELRSRVEDLEKRVDALEMAIGEAEEDARTSGSVNGDDTED